MQAETRILLSRDTVSGIALFDVAVSSFDATSRDPDWVCFGELYGLAIKEKLRKFIFRFKATLLENYDVCFLYINFKAINNPLQKNWPIGHKNDNKQLT